MSAPHEPETDAPQAHHAVRLEGASTPPRQGAPDPGSTREPDDRGGTPDAPDATGIGAGYDREVDDTESVAANRHWWDDEAATYYEEHGAFLGDADLVWGPEGVTEAQLGLLGDLDGRRVLEFGAGAAQGARYVAGRGGRVVATDLSLAMLRQGERIDAGRAGVAPPLLQCDASALPFADASFDVVFSAYGAVPFVADSARLLRECARVLVPGGLLVFSTTHPVRWAFPDVPGPAGLTATMSYFDRTPYSEEDVDGTLVYVEHHRTLGDRVREITAAGLHLVDLVEPEWPETTTETWGGWSPLRGRLLPGTAIFVCRRPATT